MTLEEAITKLNRYGRRVTFPPADESEPSIIVENEDARNWFKEYFDSYKELIDYAEDI